MTTETETEIIAAPAPDAAADLEKIDCPAWLPCGGAPNALQLYKDGHAICDFDGEYFDPEQMAEIRAEERAAAAAAGDPAPAPESEPKPKAKRSRSRKPKE